MFDPIVVKYLTFRKLNYLDVDYFEHVETIEKLEEIANDSMFEMESGKAREFYDFLANLLFENQESLKINQDLYTRISKIFYKLFWQALPALGSKFKTNALNNNVVFLLRNELDLKYYIQKLLSTYEYGLGPDKEERQHLIYSLQNNSERLGDQSITVENVKDLPTVKNWIKDYNSSQSFKGGRSHFNQINYISNSQNIKNLTAKDKEILSKILEIYDWLLFPPAGPTISENTNNPQLKGVIFEKKFPLFF